MPLLRESTRPRLRSAKTGLARALLVLASLAAGCTPGADPEISPDDLASDDARATTPTPLPADSPWASPEACETAVQAGRRSPRAAGVARLATWNVRWFPDGAAPGSRPQPTNVRWLACTVAWLNADVVALQEIQKHERARTAIAALLARLEELTGDVWRAEIDTCRGDDAQHQGFLYNTRRATLSSLRAVDWSRGEATQSCSLSSRPAWSAYVRIADGPDFHLASAHLKSGVDARSFGIRRTQLAGLPALDRNAQAEAADTDLVVAGDLNTMGCQDAACERAIEPLEEVAQLSTEVSAAGARRVWNDLACTKYHTGEARLLDHFVVSRAMGEARLSGSAAVAGYCAELRCESFPAGTIPRVYREVSDHCPVVLDLDGRDLD